MSQRKRPKETSKKQQDRKESSAKERKRVQTTNNARARGHREKAEDKGGVSRQAPSQSRRKRPKKRPFIVIVLDSIHRFAISVKRDFKQAISMLQDPKQREKMETGEKVRQFSVLGMIVLVTLSVLLIGLYGIYWGFTHKNGQEVLVAGEVKAIIWDTEIEASTIVKTVKSKIEKEVDNLIELTDTIALNPIHTKKKNTITMEALVSDLVGRLAYNIRAYTMTINGSPIATVAQEEDVQRLLDKKIEPFLQAGLDIVETGFVETIEMIPVFVSGDKIETLESLDKKISATSQAEEIYEVKMGDSLELIASTAGMTLQELLDKNPLVTVEKLLQIGDQLILQVEKPIISVITKERITYVAVVEKTVERKENKEQYLNYSRVIQQGKNGQEEVEAEIVRINGFEIEEKIISTTMLVEPIPEIIEVGTGKVPPKRALGVFRMPTWGRVSEYFEARSGKHQGVDIANSKGIPIKAADGGVVIEAGWNNGYGKSIVIDHENGFTTRYAHCSELLIAVGDKVGQGENIGKMGSTGNSTGNHLHFEMRKDGELVNPFSYIE